MSQESTDFLLKVRVCGLIDMLGLVYRTALPMPYWALYFYLCPTIGAMLRILYITVKFYDLSWKSRGAAEAFIHFVTSKIVSCGAFVFHVTSAIPTNDFYFWFYIIH